MVAAESWNLSKTESRRQAIIALIGRKAIHTQQELVDALGAEGYDASQASVSRDIAALGLSKRGGRYVRPAVPVQQDPLQRRLRETLLAVIPAGPNLVVLKTPSGDANYLTVALDNAPLTGVIGTVAGDDTIFIATPGEEASQKLISQLLELSGLSNS